MREVHASEAKARLAELLTEVEHGETVVIIRHGKPIARIVPEQDERRARVERVFAAIDEFRKTMPSLTLEEIQSARHDGHRY